MVHQRDNPKAKKKEEHEHSPHVHPAGYYHSRVPHVHTVKYRTKDGEDKVYRYPYEIIEGHSNTNKKLRNH